MPKEKKVNKNITGIIIAYFLIYVVWGVYLLLYRYGSERHTTFLAWRITFYSCRTDPSYHMLFKGRKNIQKKPDKAFGY